MSPIAHLVVTDAEHLRTLAALRLQLTDTNQMPEAHAIYEGMFLLTQQLRDRARLLISMGKSA
ncbi:hypothetical protein EV679_2546 [Kerstersia gyiorum]|uniref:Uncharacterized protein n=1 Tax=Kerstersia gyiorum TaxID=206506 RepID=A0A4Q7MKQ0_9BURK|nr:hypothetical protein [Kerstersia gyiorum]KAB0541537.1 hypothetical protein F7P85_16790 [Kerstersia gyiorum]RZS67332.1 hypothetical protein EV679_2546 [Kerstersia gyiorum]